MVVAVILVVLLGLGAIVVDAGALYSHRRQIQSAADAAALAGVQELPANPASAIAMAEEYATRNSSEVSERSFEVATTYSAGDTLVARLQDPNMGLFLARFLDRESAPVGAKAAAVISSPRAFSRGVMPFGLMALGEGAGFGYGFGSEETVKFSPPDGVGAPGLFGFLALTDPPGGNASNANQPGGIKYDIEHGGVPNPVYIGSDYHPQSGINGITTRNALNALIAGDNRTFGEVVQVNDDGTVSILDYDARRLVVVPIIIAVGTADPYSWDGVLPSGYVKVIGFAYFYIEGVGLQGNKAEVTGRFIRPLGADDDVLEWGRIDPYGAIAFRLID